MNRILALIFGLTLLASCTVSNEVQERRDLGEFSLGHNVVVASKMTQGPLSRDATAEEWIASLKAGVEERFGRYEGSQLYHVAISVEGFMLAPPGVPVVYNPRSVLVVNVTIWDDAAAKKLNEEVEQFTIFEDTTGDSVLVGSGHRRTKEEQMAGLTQNAMDAIEDWMAAQHAEKGWFAKRPETVEDAETAPDAPKPSED